ncbi:MAG TPA: dihydrolipoamide acetyltransferase family protein, partial [Usitatibacter sp.]|nr:dihydrolipoamide acetyltransferase family protein [Usitatibacter sp.]
MGTYVIKMPDIGEGIAEVELVEWHVKPGDVVAEEQVLADVMTDKATVEIPSHVAGKVVALTGKPGEVIAVGSEIIRLEVEGKGNVDDAAPARPAAKVEAAPAPAPKPAPAAPKPAPAPVPTLSLASSRPEPQPDNEKPLAAPAVRRRAKELGIDLAGVSGSGPDGRITQEDLEGLGGRGNALRFAVPGGGKVGVQRHGEESVPVIGLRRKIAEKMQDAKRRIPHFTYVEEVDVTALEEARVQLNARWKSQRGHLTMLPFLMHAIVRTLPDYHEINARFDDDNGTLTKYAPVHIGIATQTPNGLMVPVVRNAEARDLWSCASEVARLAEAARNGKASREELVGSTITITSLGALGGIVTTPVINRPEVAIIGPNKQVVRPVWQGEQFVPRTMMNLSSSFDHRVIDGYVAAR